MSRVLADTSAWCALYVCDDQDHSRALEWYEGNKLPLVATDYVIDELLTLLRYRGERLRAIEVAHDLTKVLDIRIKRILRPDFNAAIEPFRHIQEKFWSFTGCARRVVMEQLGITRAFSLR